MRCTWAFTPTNPFYVNLVLLMSRYCLCHVIVAGSQHGSQMSEEGEIQMLKYTRQQPHVCCTTCSAATRTHTYDTLLSHDTVSCSMHVLICCHHTCVTSFTIWLRLSCLIMLPNGRAVPARTTTQHCLTMLSAGEALGDRENALTGSRHCSACQL